MNNLPESLARNRDSAAGWRWLDDLHAADPETRPLLREAGAVVTAGAVNDRERFWTAFAAKADQAAPRDWLSWNGTTTQSRNVFGAR